MNLKTLKTGLLSALVAGTIYMPVSNAMTSSEIKKTSTEIKRIIIEEAENSRVPAALALAVAKVESNFNEDALSPVGARGVMQIMPKTGQRVFGVRRWCCSSSPASRLSRTGCGPIMRSDAARCSELAPPPLCSL